MPLNLRILAYVICLSIALASNAFAQETRRGFVDALDCGMVTNPTTGGILCLQTADLGGRTKETLYRWTGSAWTAWAAGGTGLASLNGLVAGTQTFANDTNVTMGSSGSTHTLGWAGLLAVLRGGTGASTASGARTALGLAIGSDVQAFNNNLSALASEAGTGLWKITGPGTGTPAVAGTDYLAPNGSAASLTSFPTFNQSTSGNAATASVAAAGDSATAFFSSGTIEVARLPAASTTESGVAEAAIAAEVTTGTDAARYVTPLALAGSTIFGLKTAQVSVFDPTVAVTTGDGMAYFVIPRSMNGMNLVGVRAHVNTVSSSGAITIDIARCALVATGDTCSGTVVAPLSTKLTIDANESKSTTAAVPAVIDTANDDVATDQVYRLDVDGAGTGTLGLIMLMEFALP